MVMRPCILELLEIILIGHNTSGKTKRTAIVIYYFIVFWEMPQKTIIQQTWYLNLSHFFIETCLKYKYFGVYLYFLRQVDANVDLCKANVSTASQPSYILQMIQQSWLTFNLHLLIHFPGPDCRRQLCPGAWWDSKSCQPSEIKQCLASNEKRTN